MPQLKSIFVVLAASYVFDWIILIVIGLLTIAFNNADPNYHAFSLLDLSISYPNVTETVSISSLVLASIVGPAIIILLICIFLVPGRTELRRTSKSQIVQLKLWEWNVGWLGLALAVLTELLVVSAVKNIIGKPRPVALALCQPDASRVAEFTVGGYARDISSNWVLVDYRICQQTDSAMLRDAFRSFPSGHAATAFSGLIYLTLYLCSKLSIAFPVIPIKTHFERFRYSNSLPHGQLAGMKKNDDAALRENRDEAAAAPLWLVLLMYVPLGTAIFIAGSRYFNYKHHGFDVLSGSVLGLLTGWFGFRWYHPSLTTGSGWAWGNRSVSRAFGVGVGQHGYVKESPYHFESNQGDVEMGTLLRHSRYQAEGSTSIPSARVEADNIGNTQIGSPTSIVHPSVSGSQGTMERAFA